jgi:hypothetical protein
MITSRRIHLPDIRSRDVDIVGWIGRQGLEFLPVVRVSINGKTIDCLGLGVSSSGRVSCAKQQQNRGSDHQNDVQSQVVIFLIHFALSGIV